MAGDRVTLADVASRAGVSPSTASLAFSGAGPVAEATRARVLAAATELGYAGPDPLARSLRQRRSGVIGVVIAERLRHAFRDPVTVVVLDAMSEVLSSLGSALLLLPDSRDADPAGTSDPGTGPGPAGSPSPRLGQVPLDALVFATGGADDDPLLDQAIARGVPVVGVEGPRRPGVPVVDLDQRYGSRRAAAHLTDLGHRDIAVVTLPLGAGHQRGPANTARQAQASIAVARERLAGVQEVLGTALPVVEAATNLVEEGERVAPALLAGTSPPTAVIVQSDLLAVGVVRAALRAGLRVPGDLSVVGFDGIDTSGWLPELSLTTVEQPMARKGYLAGQMVADLLSGRTPADVTLPVTLRPGTTTGPPTPCDQ